MITKEEYKKKIALCDKLGAKKFQKVVLKTEELKFKVIKKVFPNFITHYDKYCDRRREKSLKRAKNDSERQKIINDCRNQKIAMRRELNREQNRNYHMDENKPTEFLYYLNWNKSVHKKGLIRNAILLAALSGGLALGIFPVFASIGIAYELIGAFVNFQCINIQNSHIYRYKIIEESLRKREQNRNKNNVANYSQAAKVYARSIEGTMNIPTIEQLIANVKTKEEAEELRKMIQTVAKANAKRKPQSQFEGSKHQQPKEEQQEEAPKVIQPQQVYVETNKTQQNSEDIRLEIEKMMEERIGFEQLIPQQIGVQKSIGGKK